MEKSLELAAALLCVSISIHRDTQCGNLHRFDMKLCIEPQDKEVVAALNPATPSAFSSRNHILATCHVA